MRSKHTATIKRKASNNPDFPLLLSVAVLLFFGLLMVFSASSLGGGALGAEGNIFYYINRQVRWALLGVGVLFAAMYLPLDWVRKMTPMFSLLVVSALVAVLFVGVGAEEYGASRWLLIGPVRFQPSELGKLALVFVLAALFSSWKGAMRRVWPHVCLAVGIIGLFSGLVLVEPDLGTTFVIGSAGLFMLFVAGARLDVVFLLGGAGLGGGIFSVMNSSYQMRRWEIYRNPLLDPLDGGYQIIQGLYAIGSGGIRGVGLGNSHQVYWVPQKHTDFIFAILAEETGFIGAALVILMFLLFMTRGFVIARRAPTNYMRYLALGLTYIIAMQAWINVAVVTNLIPTTGITLPFISYGGTSLLMTLAASGLILNISRFAQKKGKTDHGN